MRHTPTLIVHIVLHEPEIPPNTGNVIRLCANIGATLHLIEPLGFDLSDRHLRRAGLDYRVMGVMRRWPDFAAWRKNHPQCRILAASRHGTVRYDQIAYQHDDALLFGCETRGLPTFCRQAATAVMHLPMRPGNRSLNLSNSVAVVAYEAWRQQHFA